MENRDSRHRSDRRNARHLPRIPAGQLVGRMLQRGLAEVHHRRDGAPGRHNKERRRAHIVCRRNADRGSHRQQSHIGGKRSGNSRTVHIPFSGSRYAQRLLHRQLRSRRFIRRKKLDSVRIERRFHMDRARRTDRPDIRHTLHTAPL